MNAKLLIPFVLMMFTAMSAKSDEAVPRPILTVNADVPLKRKLELSIVNNDARELLCSATIQGDLVHDSNAVPSRTLLMKGLRFWVNSRNRVTPPVLFGDKNLRELGIPGYGYTGGKVVDISCMVADGNNKKALLQELAEPASFIQYTKANGRFALWDPRKSQDLIEFPDDKVSSATFAQDYSSIALIADRSLVVRSYPELKTLLVYTLADRSQLISMVSLSYNGEYVALIETPFSMSAEEQTLKIWNVRESRIIASHKFPTTLGLLSKMAFVPEDQLLAMSVRGKESGKHELKFLAIPTLREIQSFPNLDMFSGMALSPNGQFLAMRSEEGKVQVFDTNSKELVFVRDAANGSVYLTFSPDSSRIAIVRQDWLPDPTRTYPEIFDLATGASLYQLPELIDSKQEVLDDISFSPDNKNLMMNQSVYGSEGDVVRIFNLETGSSTLFDVPHRDKALFTPLLPRNGEDSEE